MTTFGRLGPGRPEPLTFRGLQEQVRPWEDYNFGAQPSYRPLLGVIEEVGELAHAHLKADQGIRGTKAEHRAAKIDAIGDVIVFLADYCGREGIDFQEAVETTWAQVKTRDWKKYPKTGKAETEPPETIDAESFAEPGKTVEAPAGLDPIAQAERRGSPIANVCAAEPEDCATCSLASTCANAEASR